MWSHILNLFFIYASSSFFHIKFLWTYFLRWFYYFYHLVRINCSIPGNLKMSFHICSKDIRMNFNTHILSGKKIIESHFYTFWSWEFFLSKTKNLYLIQHILNHYKWNSCIHLYLFIAFSFFDHFEIYYHLFIKTTEWLTHTIILGF